MKISEADILMVPGYTNSGPDHWQSRWEKQMKTARRVKQDDWLKPVVEDWTDGLIAGIEESKGSLVLVAHSLGGQVVAQAIKKMNADHLSLIKGAFIVSPPDVENPSLRPKHLMTFGPYPREPFPFPSVVISSQNDPFCSHEVAGDMANAWGSLLVDARENGHIDETSGHGPWPDGLMVFANFMKKLSA